MPDALSFTSMPVWPEERSRRFKLFNVLVASPYPAQRLDAKQKVSGGDASPSPAAGRDAGDRKWL